MGKRLTTEEFIKRSKEIHGDKYDYSKVEYINNRTKVCIICPEHGEFWQKPDQHMSGQGCKKCGILTASVKNADTNESFIEKSKKLYGDVYDYSKVEYISSRKKVILSCPIHGIFEQRPNDHLNGYGCPKCGRNIAKNKITLSTDEFIKKAKKIHGDNRYNYSKVEYVNSHRKVCIICPEHGEFWQTANSHLNGVGCPMCKDSKLENNVGKMLLDNEINFKYQYKNKDIFGNLSLDFYIPEYNVAIECQGEQHFYPVSYFGGKDVFNKQKARDELKEFLCQKNGIKLLYYFENKKYFGTYESEAHDEKELINKIKSSKSCSY